MVRRKPSEKVWISAGSGRTARPPGGRRCRAESPLGRSGRRGRRRSPTAPPPRASLWTPLLPCREAARSQRRHTGVEADRRRVFGEAGVHLFTRAPAAPFDRVRCSSHGRGSRRGRRDARSCQLRTVTIVGTNSRIISDTFAIVAAGPTFEARTSITATATASDPAIALMITAPARLPRRAAPPATSMTPPIQARNATS